MTSGTGEGVRIAGDPVEPRDVSTEAAVHIEALMDLFRLACQQQAWTLERDHGLIGWADVRCSAGHEFSVRPLDLVSHRRPFGLDPGEPWCKKCSAAVWVAECLAALKSAAQAQAIALKATDERDESGDGHVVFAAKCSKGHHFRVTGRDATRALGRQVVTLCPGCREAADFAEGFAKIDEVVRETRSVIVKNYRNGADIRCRRGHPHTFRVDSWDERRAIRPDFCGACESIAKFQEFSEQAKDLGITVLESRWIAKSRPHQAICFGGHEFGLIPNKLKRGCPECPQGMYGGAVPPHDVYYIVSGRDAVTGEETVKPGISSGSGYNRLRQHAEGGLTVQHLLISGLPLGAARVLEKFVLNGLDGEGWLSLRGVEYFPVEALPDVMDMVGEWFTDQPGLSPRQVVVDADEVLDAVQAPKAADVIDIDPLTAVVFESGDVKDRKALTC